MSQADEIICPTCQTTNSPELQECFVCGESLTGEDMRVSESSPDKESPEPEGSEKNLDDKWLDELARLGGEEEKVPIDQVWPSPDWLDPVDEESDDPTDNLLKWLREEEGSEVDSADEEQDEEIEEEPPAGDEAEGAIVADWLDEINSFDDPQSPPFETESKVDETLEKPEDEFPDWLTDLVFSDDFSETDEARASSSLLEGETQDQASIAFTEPADSIDDLAKNPERLVEKSLPPRISDEISETGGDRAEGAEHGQVDPDKDSAGDEPRFEEMLQRNDVALDQSEGSGEERPTDRGDEIGDLSQGQVDLGDFEQRTKPGDPHGSDVEDYLDEGLDEKLDWFLDEDELGEQVPLAPLDEQEALLAELHTMGEEDETFSTDQVEDIFEASEVNIDPAWLASLTTPLGEETEWESRVEESGPLTGLRGVLDRPQFISLEDLGDPIREDALTNEIIRRTALLERLTEGRSSPGRLQGTLKKSSTTTWSRLLLALLLTILLVVGWLAPFTDFQADSATQASDFESVIENAAGKTALMAFDYAPAWGGELDLVADSLLENLADSGINVLTVSQSPAGVGMANLAIERSEDIDHLSLGFLPGEVVGLRNLAVCLNDRIQCETIFGTPFGGEVQAYLDNLGVIVVLAAERDEITRWIEQVGGIEGIEMIAGVTQALAPVAKPYVVSGQLAGVLASPADTARYIESANGQAGNLPERASSLALANWLSIGTLTFAILFSGLAALAGRRPRKSRMSKNV